MGLEESLHSLHKITRLSYSILLGLTLVLSIAGIVAYCMGEAYLLAALSFIISSFLPLGVARGIRRTADEFWKNNDDRHLAASCNSTLIAKLSHSKFLELLIFLVGLSLLLVYVTVGIDFRSVAIPVCISAGFTYIISLLTDFKLSIIDHRLNNHAP